MAPALTAAAFVAEMERHQSDAERDKLVRYFKHGKDTDVFMGIRMGTLFNIAKAHIDMPPAEIVQLLKSPVHEVRAGALSVMDKQARRKKTPEPRRKELYDIYMRHHAHIDNWDLVDLAAVYVVGGYLYDKPRDVLYKLARSKNIWERRTAIVATGYFIRNGEVDDTFRIGEMLIHDKEDLIHKAAGGWVRHAGGRDRARLRAFLDQYAATLPRTYLRYAIERLDKKEKDRYMKLT